MQESSNFTTCYAQVVGEPFPRAAHSARAADTAALALRAESLETDG